MHAITFFDDKTERVAPQNWVIAAMSALEGRVPLRIVCEPRQAIHEVVQQRFADARVLLFNRDLFYGGDRQEWRRIAAFLTERPQLVWHVSHFENGATPTRILHDLVKDSPSTALLTKTGTVHPQFTADNYYPDGGSRVRRIFAVSGHTKDHIERQCGVPGSQISVNYMGADRELFRPERITDPEANRLRFGLQAGDVGLGLVGSLHERKNLLETLDVLAPIARDRPELFLIFAGEGPLEEVLRQRVEQLGVAQRTRFLGHWTDVVSLMGALDLLVLFSRREGAVPRVLLEAMAMGTIVIAADLGAISEVVVPEQSGLLVRPHDTEALDVAVRGVLANEEQRARLGQGAIGMAERFDRVEWIEAFRDEVVELVNAEPRDLDAIVKQRARELRQERVGYSDAVTTVADELYRNERGKETRIGKMGATTGLIGPLVAENDHSLVAKTKKGKARAIGKIQALISPWVADVYEEDWPD